MARWVLECTDAGIDQASGRVHSPCTMYPFRCKSACAQCECMHVVHSCVVRTTGKKNCDNLVRWPARSVCYWASAQGVGCVPGLSEFLFWTGAAVGVSPTRVLSGCVYRAGAQATAPISQPHLSGGGSSRRCLHRAGAQAPRASLINPLSSVTTPITFASCRLTLM